ncbi:hypothetical protein MLOOGBEN_28830 [Bacillus sp. EB106-08-02-XG196]|uniref:hypothetical protein n=1 Tax=Bacillus sp. EB106-08-02-XG196 TaxID=2737049 RepID=UPI0015C490E8|nr:hypothetical protein [Bacillus sp. EB106-08-02-XG196]NWQ44685.1 hypothetical protein [Bacillus sp. EB106-08-02-XG196]
MGEVSKFIDYVIGESIMKNKKNEVKFTVSLDEIDNQKLELIAKSLGLKKVPFVRELIRAGITEAIQKLELNTSEEFKEFLFNDKSVDEFPVSFLEEVEEKK